MPQISWGATVGKLCSYDKFDYPDYPEKMKITY